jgi:hypothetical protein
MTWAETSTHLNVPQSTCWFRKNRALQKIYNIFDEMEGDHLYDNVKEVLRGKVSKLDETS